jgi:hypothetical protein
MCVASPAGAKGGLAADISFLIDRKISDNKALHFDIPLFRPIFFGLAFDMLQFEPAVTLKFRKEMNDKIDLRYGPSLGISLHYGPSYLSESEGENRLESFFSLGPIIGAYLGWEFKNPNKAYNFEIGISPYVTPLFGIENDPSHDGVIIGGLVDFAFNFN